MKYLLLLFAPILLWACSKRIIESPVSWRLVLLDSNDRVVDSTREIFAGDSLNVKIQGPAPISLIPPLAPQDTIYWALGATFGIIVGPGNNGPAFGNQPIINGGCAVQVSYLNPTLDRSGWMLQRTQGGTRINMFKNNQPNSYDGSNNSFPYPVYVDGIAYPSPHESDPINVSYTCGATQGSCVLSGD